MRILIITLLFSYTRCDYYKKRSEILDLESKITVGGNITLTDKESLVNTCLMKHKFNEVDYGINHPDFYNFSHHFFSYKNKIADSKVFQIIKAMPKGAILHIHLSAALGADYMVNITYMDHLYVCFKTRIKFLYSIKVPEASCDDRWQLMSDARRATKNVTEFDMELKKHFSIAVANPDILYPSSREIWNGFRKYFNTVYGLLSYMPVWKQYIYDVLKAFREDNIMYAEIRAGLVECYELNGTIRDEIETSRTLKEVIDKFIIDYPDFIGANLIVTDSRKRSNLNASIKYIEKVKEKVPGLIIGYDLVGEEDLGKPLLDFVPVLRRVKDMNFFFHAGETNWYGTSTDENLLDAVLLGAKRIGHAYALTKHPVIMNEVIERDIAIEVNVVSNAVLSLVRDIRNHPLSMFLSHGVPVVLSSDDPGAWGANALSDDFYVAFMGVASKHSNLRLLKTLALNSLKYSVLDPGNKHKALYDFNLKWNRFVNNFVCP